MKSLKLLRAVITVMFTAFLVTGCSGEGPYESFSLAMDTLAGEGNWSDKGHSSSFFGGGLTVSGVTVTSEGGALEIATVEVKKPLEKDQLKAIFEASDWKNQKETTLAEALTLKGVKRILLPGPNNVTNTTNVEEINLEALTLAAADSNAQSGLAGFLKAARVKKAAYKNLQAASKGGTAGDMEMTLAQMNAEGLAFDAEPLAGLDELDPTGLATVVSSFSARTLTFKDMLMTLVRGPEANSPGILTISVAALEQKDLKGFRAAAHWAMSGFKFNLTGTGEDDISFALDSVALNDADMTSYINTVMPVIIASSMEGADVDSAVNSVQTFGDFFVSPFSLKDATVKGLSFAVGNIISMKMADCTFTGPAVAGTVTPEATSTVNGLEIILPESAEGLEGSVLDMYQFGQDFGMSRFVLDMASESSYDAAAGRLTSHVSKLSVKDLVDISMTFNLGGLTAERIAALKQISLDNVLVALIDPAGTFGDMSIENIDMTYANTGLVERIYAYAGKTKLGGATADQVKDMAVGAVSLGLAAQGEMYLESPELLSASLTTFLKEPKSLQITMKPEKPLSFPSAQSYGGDQNALLNALNLTVIANGEAGVQPLRFNIPLTPADLSQMDDEELEEYLENE